MYGFSNELALQYDSQRYQGFQRFLLNILEPGRREQLQTKNHLQDLTSTNSESPPIECMYIKYREINIKNLA